MKYIFMIRFLCCWYAQLFNCSFFDDLFSKGFNTRQTDIRPANSINYSISISSSNIPIAIITTNLEELAQVIFDLDYGARC